MLDGRQPHRGERPVAKRSRKRRASPVTIIGLVLILSGLGALGWVGYQYLGTNVVSEREFTKSKENLRKVWDSPPTASPSKTGGATKDPAASPSKTGGATKDPAADPVGNAVPGDAIALLRVPSWGADYEVPILKGTSLDILANGVGMYTSSVAPGEVGNLAIAGHRITHGEPFAQLLKLRPGSEVVIETQTKIFTYVMDNSPADLTVDETANWVLEPVPGEPQTKPTKALLTLTTCQDLFRSPDRSVGFAHLASTVNK